MFNNQINTIECQPEQPTRSIDPSAVVFITILTVLGDQKKKTMRRDLAIGCLSGRNPTSATFT